MSACSLLGGDDPPVYRVDGASAASAFVLTCDHAGRSIPVCLGDLGLSAETLATHVAWDLGVAELGQHLASRLDAFLIRHNYSRLVIDMNRPPGAPDSIVTLSENTRVQANEGIGADDVSRRVEELFRPYHDRIRAELDERAARGVPTVLVALHSFTPVYRSVARPWHAGVLYGRDARLARPVLAALRRDPALVVGDNEPYSVSDATDYTLVVHGERRGIPHVELEIRQDLLAGAGGIRDWAERLGDIVEEAATDILAA